MIRRKYLVLSFAIMALGFLPGCGGTNSVQGSVNGQTFDLAVSQVDCLAGPPSGGVAGFDGGLNAPLVCNVTFRTDGYFGDFVSITVNDVRTVYSNLGAWHIMGGGAVDGFLTLQGVPQPIFSGQVRFTQISNVAGNRVEADYEIFTASADISGHFEEKVRLGY